MNDFFTNIKTKIDEKGIFIIVVGKDENKPAFAYTIGARLYGLPDIVATGSVPPASYHRNFTDLFSNWRSHGLVTGEVSGIIQDFQLKLVLLRNSTQLIEETVMQAENFYRKFPEYDCLDSSHPRYAQIIWPDRKGLFPGANAYDKRFVQTLFPTHLTH